MKSNCKKPYVCSGREVFCVLCVKREKDESVKGQNGGAGDGNKQIGRQNIAGKRAAAFAGKTVFQFGGWYHVSKYSVEALSDALRIEMKPFGVDVCIIEPGAIKTDWGIIAADHLEESSRGTAYEKAANGQAATMRKAYTGNFISKPTVISRAISRAVNSRRPRTRYMTGFGSHTAVFFHWLLPDRWWDALMRKFMN